MTDDELEQCLDEIGDPKQRERDLMLLGLTNGVIDIADKIDTLTQRQAIHTKMINALAVAVLSNILLTLGTWVLLLYCAK